MIRKTSKGFMVTSESGKPLSSDDLTHDQAVARLAQVEHFKAVDAAKNSSGALHDEIMKGTAK